MASAMKRAGEYIQEEAKKLEIIQNPIRVMVSLSGGMDSTTVLAECVARYGKDNVKAVIFAYGSKHNPYENKQARFIANHYHVKWTLLDLGPITLHFESNLLRHGEDIPEGHYEAETMSQTVVPARNMLFISALAGLAWTEGYREVWLGIHAGDHAIYPDCRPQFFNAIREAVELGTDNRVTLRAPFLHDNKRKILQWGHSLDVPYQITRTCYKDQRVACGKCGACQERLEAFASLGRDDPIEYESRTILPK